jgi:preprotein translocase subunit SecY
VLSNLKNIFKVPDLRNKIFFTLAMIALYRFGTAIRVPGIDNDAVKQFQESARSLGALGFLNLFSGGAFASFSIFALGIMPYITASIIMQVLGVVIPKLEKLQQEGAVGQRKITQYTRYLAIAIATLQATGLTFIFGRGQGSAFFGAAQNAPNVKLLPVLVTNLLGSAEGWRGDIVSFVNKYLVNSQNIVYITLFSLMIIAFAYFYNSIAFDPIRQADQLRRQGGFIPGIRPGPQTERYLAKAVNRITLPGAVFVAVIAILPYLLLWAANVTSFPFAGTTVLIAVGVALDTMRQMESQMMMRNYEGFLK